MAFHLDIDMPRELAPLAWLIGHWEGAGVVGYPSMEESMNFGQELDVTHDGRPFLEWQSRTWILDADGNKVRLAARELGFWRVVNDGKEAELLLTHPTGIVEMYYGTIEPAKIHLRTDGVIRSPHAKDYKAASRLYGLVDGDLMYAMDMAAGDNALQPHLSAQLKRVD
ncbi:MAG: FABP family protein [Micrococcales bacterium]|nr:FABP family protein [Micrococcales bacterium]